PLLLTPLFPTRRSSDLDELADLCARPLPATCHQLVGRQQHAGGAKSALRGVARDEFVLQLRKLAAFREALDGLHRLAGNLRRKREAAARRAAVDHDGACATDAVLAAEMGSGQLHVLAQEVREVLARLHAPFQRLAVQSRFDRDVFFPEEVGHGVTFSDNELSTRRVSTVAMWSLVSARSPVVSSGVRSCRIACSKADVSGSGVASPVTAAETAPATLAWSTHPKYASRAVPIRSRRMVASAAKPTKAKSPWRRDSSANPTAIQGCMAGNLMATISSPGLSSVSNKPLKKSSAFTSRSPTTLLSASVAPSATAQAGSSAAGSA